MYTNIVNTYDIHDNGFVLLWYVKLYLTYNYELYSFTHVCLSAFSLTFKHNYIGILKIYNILSKIYVYLKKLISCITYYLSSVCYDTKTLYIKMYSTYYCTIQLFLSVLFSGGRY